MNWGVPERFARSPETADRALVGACAAVWLLALGFAVAAGVALANLGSGRSTESGDGGGTPWLLYVVIAVSVVVIALSVPLLLKARNTAAHPAPAAAPQRAMVRPTVQRDPPDYPGPVPARHPSNVISAADLDRMWLRCGVGVLTATGAAMAAVAIATHLMVVDMVGASWAVYGLAAAITAGMVAIPVVLLRQLRETLGTRSV